MDVRRRMLFKKKQSSNVGDNEGLINIDNYLTIEALEDGLTASLSTNACEYCVDGDGNWKSLAAGNATESINAGQTLSFRGNLTPSNSDGIGTFTISKKCNLKGNVMSMLFGDNAADNFSLSGKDYAFNKLFYNCKTIINANNLSLPATTLANNCYKQMFNNCTGLTTTPELPATTLETYCYIKMFRGCTSLTTAPALPATTLAISCYSNMFSGCTGLTTAPDLPATTLANNCYSYMFDGCTSLTTAPALPATTLANYCYSYMFYGCTSLTTAPALPATTLTIYCYSCMFNDCTSLTTAPALPATTLANYCYYYMFSGTNVLPDCSNIDFTSSDIIASGGLIGLFAGTKVTDSDLNHILPKNNNEKYCLPVTTLAISCYSNMFNGCTGLTTAPELPATTLAKECYYYMFHNCTSLTTAPTVLPATTLAKECYDSMFRGCTSLTTAPELPATTLANYCYNYMFSNCSKLNYIKMLATDISASYCLYNWVSSVSSTGTFIKNAAMTSLPTGTSGIPSGWTVQDA